MGWLFGGKPKTPQDQVNDIKTDHIPENLRPQKPELSALGDIQDLGNKLSAQTSLNNQNGSAAEEKAKYNREYASQADTLERAARHAKELDKSKHAAEAVAMSKEEEKTKQMAQQKSIEQYKLQIKQAENEAIRIKGHEERETLKHQAQIHKEQSDYNHKLAVQRDQAKMEVEKQTKNDMLRAQEESIQKQEQMRRETLEYESKLRRENDLNKAKAEARAKYEIDREHHDVKMKEIALEQQEKNKGLLAQTELWVQATGDFLSSNFSTGPAAARSCAVIGGIALAWFSTKQIAEVGKRTAIRYLDRPVLVRETSRQQLLRNPRQSINQIVKNVVNRSKEMEKDTLLQRVFLEEKVTNQIVDIGIGAEQTMKNKGFLRNVLLHGPPGTGKTLFAKELAKHSSMDYAIVSGGDFAPLGSAAVTEIHNLWDWAERRNNNKGVILFIDEADAFLQKRANKHGTMSEDMRSTINAFLMKSGTESKKVMIVLASNQPEQLDSAVKDRCDVTVLFPLPGKPERLQMLRHYFQTNILQPCLNPKSEGLFSFFTKRRALSPDDNVLDNLETILEEVAEKTDGLSGRAINKLVTSWEQSLYQSVEGQLTKEMMMEKVEQFMSDKAQKETWEAHEL